MKRRSFTLLMPALLSGCGGSLLPKPAAAPSRFTLGEAALPVRMSAQPTTAADAPVLLVATPRAAAGFDSTRMLYLRRPQELQAFAFSEWVDTPAQMLAPLLVQALQASGAFSAVLLAPTAAHAGLRLETEIIRLQQDFTGVPSRLRLSLRAVLLDSATRSVIGWQSFDEAVVAASDDAAGGAVAAGRATRQALAALAAFCAGHAKRPAVRGP